MKKLILIICVVMFVTGCTKCPEDSKKVDGKCYMFHYKVPEEELTCPISYELIDNKCVKTEKRKAEYVNTCTNGYTLQNNSCIKIESTQFNVEYSCPDSHPARVYDRCYNDAAVVLKRYFYVCAGYMESNPCKFERQDGVYKIYGCPTINTYKCNNEQYAAYSYYGCDIVTGKEVDKLGVCWNNSLSVPAISNNVCPTGFTKNSSGTNCIRTLSANVKTTYSCNSGEELEGSDCITKTETDAILSPVCTDGYELIEQQCILAEEVSPIKNK